jgi:hypothetical protein
MVQYPQHHGAGFNGYPGGYMHPQHHGGPGQYQHYAPSEQSLIGPPALDPETEKKLMSKLKIALISPAS